MNVTLLSINAKYVHSSLAVWFLASGVERDATRRHDVRVVEATINQNMRDIVARVCEGSPERVGEGLSGRLGESTLAQGAQSSPDLVGISTYIWNAAMLPELLCLLRERLPNVRIVLGGPEASHNPEYWLANGADYVLRGEGERSFPALLDALEWLGQEARTAQSSTALATDISQALRQIPGLCFREDEGLRVNALATPSDKSANPPLAAPSGELTKMLAMPSAEPAIPLAAPSCAPPSPYTDAYFRALCGRIAYIETSRGCPFQCAYCLSGGSRVRFFPMDSVKAQIAKLAQSDTQTIKFVDRTFNANPARAFEIFEYVIGLDTGRCFHFEVAADLFDEQTVALMRTASPGRIQLEAGIQSFHQPTLDAVARRTDLGKVEGNIQKLLSGNNIHLHIDLIAGLPHETPATFAHSFNRAYALGAHTLQLGFLKLLHGSRLREQAKSLGIVYHPKPPYEIISSPWLTEAELAMLKRTENALQHTYNKGRFLSALGYVLAASDLRPFTFFQGMGDAVPNHAMPLGVYAERVYAYCAGLANVNPTELADRMTCDLLAMTKGKIMPSFLKTHGVARKQAVAIAAKALARAVDSDEAVVLSTGQVVYVDSRNRDPVTGLYRLHFSQDDCASGYKKPEKTP